MNICGAVGKNGTHILLMLKSLVCTVMDIKQYIYHYIDQVEVEAMVVETLPVGQALQVQEGMVETTQQAEAVALRIGGETKILQSKAQKMMKMYIP